jgi:hypothetical protein
MCCSTAARHRGHSAPLACSAAEQPSQQHMCRQGSSNTRGSSSQHTTHSRAPCALCLLLPPPLLLLLLPAWAGPPPATADVLAGAAVVTPAPATIPAWPWLLPPITAMLLLTGVGPCATAAALLNSRPIAPGSCTAGGGAPPPPTAITGTPGALATPPGSNGTTDSNWAAGCCAAGIQCRSMLP